MGSISRAGPTFGTLILCIIQVSVHYRDRDWSRFPLSFQTTTGTPLEVARGTAKQDNRSGVFNSVAKKKAPSALDWRAEPTLVGNIFLCFVFGDPLIQVLPVEAQIAAVLHKWDL